MYKTPWFVAILLGFATTIGAAERDAASSLLSNGNFARAGADNWPADWPHPEGASWEKEGDGRFLRLRSSKPGQMILVYRQATLPKPLPPALEVRLRVRYADIQPGEKSWFDGRVMFHFKNQAGQVLKPDPGAPAFKGTSKDWIDKKLVLKVPEGAQLLEIMPCLFQPKSGTFDLAECFVFAATADELPPPPPQIPSEPLVPANPAALPPQLHVVGNKLQTPDGKTVWLQGLCVDSLQWSAVGEHTQQSIPVAIEGWKANVIRLPVKEDFWFGWNKGQKDNGLGYRKVVDQAIEAAVARGAYLVLDLHRFGAPTEDHVAFWKDAAKRYKNHPAVLFELFNEAHSISWKTWRDGGLLKDPNQKSTDVNAKENKEEVNTAHTPGMQALVDAVRGAGANNVLIAGGLDWGYDLSGVAQDFALKDRPDGHGIVYSSHIYPWKKDWQGKVLAAAEKYPIFVGEVGCPPDWKGFEFIAPSQRQDLPSWPPDMLGLIQKHKLNWTGFSFHPKCGPMVILDWQYTPTPYWGVFVKQALEGKPFEMKSMR
jgi:endoglucanase